MANNNTQDAPEAQDYISPQEHLEDQFLLTTMPTMDILLKQPLKDRADLIALYQFIYYTAKWQKTRFASAGNRAKCTNSYIHGAFGWKEQKICRLKKTLIELGLIEQVKDVDPATGRIKGWYVRAIYLLRRDTVTRFLEASEAEANDTQKVVSPTPKSDALTKPQAPQTAEGQTQTQTTQKGQSGVRFVSKPAAKPFSARSSRLPENHTLENGQPNTAKQKSSSSKNLNIDQIDRDKWEEKAPISTGQGIHETRGGGFTDISVLMKQKIGSYQQAARSDQDTSVRPQKASRRRDEAHAAQLASPDSSPQASALQARTRQVRVTAKVADYIVEIAHRHGDRRDNANIAQIGALFARIGASESGSIDWLIVTEKEIADWQRYHPKEHIDNYMAYFFSTLRNRLGLAAS